MRNPVIEFDRLKMYMRNPYVIDCGEYSNKLTIYQPTIGDIINFGEKEFYKTLNIFITNTTAYRLDLWERKIDWNVLSDFELFCMLYQGIDPDAAKLIFGDLDITSFELRKLKKGDEESPILINVDKRIIIDSNVYNHISQYLRNVFNMFPEEKITNDAIMKKWFINKDKRQRAINEEKKKKEDLCYEDKKEFKKSV